MADWGTADDEVLDDGGAFGAGDEEVRPARRGGLRSEFKPFVARGDEYDPRAGIRGSDGYDETIAPDPEPLSPADAARRKKVNAGLYGFDETSQAVASGFGQAGALAQGAKAGIGAVGYRAITDTIEQFDAIDRGEPARQAAPAVQAYASAPPELRQKLRERAGVQLADNKDFIRDAVSAYQEYKKFSAGVAPDMPRLGDVQSPTGFVNWATQAGLASGPAMAMVMLGAAVGGAPGLIAASTGMGLGDITGDGIDRSIEANDPKRFRSADRAADAMASRDDMVPRDLGNRAGASLVAAPIYGAVEMLGPEARFIKQGLLGMGRREALKAGAAKLPFDMLKEGSEEALQKGTSMATGMAAGERSTQITTEDLKTLGEEFLTGAVVGAPISAVATAKDVYQAPGSLFEPAATAAVPPTVPPVNAGNDQAPPQAPTVNDLAGVTRVRGSEGPVDPRTGITKVEGAEDYTELTREVTDLERPLGLDHATAEVRGDRPADPAGSPVADGGLAGTDPGAGEPAAADVAVRDAVEDAALSYRRNADGTLTVTGDPDTVAALVPSLRPIPTTGGLLVGKTRAKETAETIDAMKSVPETFGSREEASAFVQKHWPAGGAEVADTGGGWVVMPRPQPETASERAEIDASIERLHGAIQGAQKSARGEIVEAVPDANLGGAVGEQAAVLGRAIRSAFNVPVVFAQNLTANGAFWEGRVVLDTEQLSGIASSPEKASGTLFAVAFHELQHASQKSTDAGDIETNAKLAAVVQKYLKPGAAEEQLAFEQGQSKRPIAPEYALAEIDANLAGGFAAQSGFWRDVYDIDGGSTARRLFYRFMQAATKFAAVMRGSRFDPERYVSNVPAVKAAYVQAMAERMGRRMPGGKAKADRVPAAVTAPTTAPAAPTPDHRLQSAEMRAELEASKADIGWQQVGGRILRDPRTAIDPNGADAVFTGDVVGRTPWLGSDLWRNRPTQGGKINEQEASDAIDKALRGEPMNARQRRFVTYTLDSIEDRMNAAEKAALEALDDALIEAQNAQSEDAAEAFWESLAEVEAQEERDAIQAQDTEDAGGAGQAAGPAARVPQEGADGAQAAQRAPSQEGLTLEAQTEAGLKARKAREQTAATADRAEQRRLADKEKADAERGEFALTGSDRAADVAAAAGQEPLFSRADHPPVTVERTPEGWPEFASGKVKIAFPQPAERFEVIPDQGQEVLSYAIMPAEGFDVLGYVELLVEDGRPVSLLDIEIAGKGKGAGRDTIEALLAGFPDTDMNISNIVEKARGFWDKMGVPEQNRGTGEAYDGTLNWDTFSERQNPGAATQGDGAGSRPGAQRNTGRDGSDRGAGVGAARQGEDGPALSRVEDDATRFAGITVEQPVFIEDTGQTATLRLDAGQAIADLDDRAQTFRRLLTCLG